MGVGIIGAGTMAERYHLPAIREIPELKFIANVNATKKRAKYIAKKFGAEAWYTNYKDMLKRDDIDIVEICTPNYLHCEMTIDAAEAKKHIIVQKPMAISVTEADKMIKAAKEADVKLMVFYQLRFNPVFEKIKKIVDSGMIGDPFMAKAHIGHMGPYDFWGAVSDWFFDPKKSGGGVLLDLGVHYIQNLRCLMGKIESVYAATESLMHKKIEDNASLILKFKNNKRGIINVSWLLKGGYFEGLELYGTKGSILFNNNWPQLRPRLIYFSENESTKFGRGWSLLASEQNIIKSTIDIHKHFINCIFKNDKPITNGEEGRRDLEIVFASYKSAKIGKEIKI